MTSHSAATEEDPVVTEEEAQGIISRAYESTASILDLPIPPSQACRAEECFPLAMVEGRFLDTSTRSSLADIIKDNMRQHFSESQWPRVFREKRVELTERGALHLILFPPPSDATPSQGINTPEADCLSPGLRSIQEASLEQGPTSTSSTVAAEEGRTNGGMRREGMQNCCKRDGDMRDGDRRLTESEGAHTVSMGMPQSLASSPTERSTHVHVSGVVLVPYLNLPAAEAEGESGHQKPQADTSGHQKPQAAEQSQAQQCRVEHSVCGRGSKRRRLGQSLRGSRGVPLLPGAHPLGFCHFRFDLEDDIPVLYIYELQLGKGTQGRGLGSTLVDVLCRHAHKVGMQAVMLTVQESNKKALQFYTQRHGFCVAPHSPDAASYHILARYMCDKKRTIEGGGT